MTISLSPATQKRLEDQMKKQGDITLDETVRIALQRLEAEVGEFIEDLDPAIQAALERAFAQSERGQSRPWDQARRELDSKFLNK